MKTSHNGISTNWYVITGASCAGKTTVILELKKQGFRVVPEPARVFIEEEMSKRRSLDEVLSSLMSDKREFQQWMFSKKLQIEDRLPSDEVIFLDRALPDSLAYFELWGLETADILQACQKHKYKRVLLFDRLPFINDGVRIEDESQRALLDQYLERNYRNLGYEIIRVPVLPVGARVELVSRLSFPY